MNTLQETRLSMLDLVTVRAGGTVGEALAIARDTARHVEQLGFTRYWVAEHHNMPGIASSATAVLVGYIAGATSRIRVGSGGIMLPNHAPLVVAEAFGTLAELYPGRIDLGLGRAPGTDRLTMRALRRDRVETVLRPRLIFRVKWRNCSGCSVRSCRNSKSSPCPAVVPRCRSGCSVQACSRPNWPLNAACLMPSPRILRQPCCCRRSRYTVAISAPRESWRNPT